jgi:hypothetical protein
MRPELFEAYDAEILDVNVLGDEIQKESGDYPTHINKPSDILYVELYLGFYGRPARLHAVPRLFDQFDPLAQGALRCRLFTAVFAVYFY